MDTENIIRNFIIGYMTFNDFIENYNKNDDIRVFINKLMVGKKMDTSYYDFNTYKIVKQTDDFNIDYYIKKHWCKIKNGYISYSAGNRLNIHDLISRIYRNTIDESIKATDYYDSYFDFLLDYCPRYLYSIDIENSGILDRLLESIPSDLKKSERGKIFKQELKEMFYIEGNKYPHWLQDSEWPLSKTGKPTKYLRSEKAYGSEARNYYFLDVDTNEEIVVFQSF